MNIPISSLYRHENHRTNQVYYHLFSILSSPSLLSSFQISFPFDISYHRSYSVRRCNQKTLLSPQVQDKLLGSKCAVNSELHLCMDKNQKKRTEWKVFIFLSPIILGKTIRKFYKHRLEKKYFQISRFRLM